MFLLTYPISHNTAAASKRLWRVGPARRSGCGGWGRLVAAAVAGGAGSSQRLWRVGPAGCSGCGGCGRLVASDGINPCSFIAAAEVRPAGCSGCGG